MGLPRSHRLPGGAVRRILADGRRGAAGPLHLSWRPRADGPARLAVRVVNARRAVDRSLLRRRIAEAARPGLASLPAVDVVATWRLGGPVPSFDEVCRRWAEARATLA